MEESDAIKIKGLQVEMKNTGEKIGSLEKKVETLGASLGEKLDRNFAVFTHQIEQLEKNKVSHIELSKELDDRVKERLDSLEAEQKTLKKTLRITPIITFIAGTIVSPLVLYLIVEYFKTH